MLFDRPATRVIQERFSCRTYERRPIAAPERDRLTAFLSTAEDCPFHTPARFKLIAAENLNDGALRGLGTYGFVRGATGFILGAVQKADRNLEDFGFLMERIILFATSIGLGTCWLGGTFNRSTFAARMALGKGETMPAVASVGYAARERSVADRVIRRGAGAQKRLSWERLFFNRSLKTALSQEEAGRFAVPLEMVRLGPSASNRQPWRVVKDDHAWHFYVQRTGAHRRRSARAFGIADMQRVDMGIAMCHFELTARELGLEGNWVLAEPDMGSLDSSTEYTATWDAQATAPARSSSPLVTARNEVPSQIPSQAP
jgi:nitroreductase